MLTLLKLGPEQMSCQLHCVFDRRNFVCRFSPDDAQLCTCSVPELLQTIEEQQLRIVLIAIAIYDITEEDHVFVRVLGFCKRV